MAIDDFTYRYVISPIFLVGGIAGSAGSTVPIVSYTQGDIFAGGLTAGGSPLNYDDFFAHFAPLPGGSLANNQIGSYPFANQATAANAIITQPLNISMMMICPARAPGGYSQKQATIAALKLTLDQHVMAGGLFSINTPGFLYTNCILVGMRDVSTGESRQVQFRYQLDFVKPLVTQQEAQQALNNLMGKLSSGAQVTPDSSGAGAGSIAWSSPSTATTGAQSGVTAQTYPANVADDGLNNTFTGPAAPSAGGTDTGFSAPETFSPSAADFNSFGIGGF